MTSTPSLFRGDLPRIVTGVEHEYKWLITDVDLPGFADGTAAVLATLGHPAGFAAAVSDSSIQSSIYLDTVDWTLTKDSTSLAVIINYGRRRAIRWLMLKDTLLWAEGRRDSLEIGALVHEFPVSHVLEAWTEQPLAWLTRKFGGPLELKPYGATTQQRRQALISSQDGCSLGLSLDETITRDESGVERATDRWLEVETSQSDFRSLSRLAAWARMITDRLGVEPHGQSKPERTADLVRRLSVR